MTNTPINLSCLTLVQLQKIFETDSQGHLKHRLVVKNGQLFQTEKINYGWFRKILQWLFDSEGSLTHIRAHVIDAYKADSQNLFIQELFLDLFDFHMIEKRNSRAPTFLSLKTCRSDLSSNFSAKILENAKKDYISYVGLINSCQDLTARLGATSISRTLIGQIEVFGKTLAEQKRIQNEIDNYLSFPFSFEELFKGLPVSPHNHPHIPVVRAIAKEIHDIIKQASNLAYDFKLDKIGLEKFLNEKQKKLLESASQLNKEAKERINPVYEDVKSYIMAMRTESYLQANAKLATAFEKKIWEMACEAYQTQEVFDKYPFLNHRPLPVEKFFERAKEKNSRYIQDSFLEHLQQMEKQLAENQKNTLEEYKRNKAVRYPKFNDVEAYFKYLPEGHEKAELFELREYYKTLLKMSFLQEDFRFEVVRVERLRTILEILYTTLTTPPLITFAKNNQNELLRYIHKAFDIQIQILCEEVSRNQEEGPSVDLLRSAATLTGQFLVWQKIAQNHDLDTHEKLKHLSKSFKPIYVLAYLFSFRYLSLNPTEKETEDKRNKITDPQQFFRNLEVIQAGSFTNFILDSRYCSLDAEANYHFGDLSKRWSCIQEWKKYMYGNCLNVYQTHFENQKLSEEDIRAAVTIPNDFELKTKFSSLLQKWRNLITFIIFFEKINRWLGPEAYASEYQSIKSSADVLFSLCEQGFCDLEKEQNRQLQSSLTFEVTKYVNELAVISKRKLEKYPKRSHEICKLMTLIQFHFNTLPYVANRATDSASKALAKASKQGDLLSTYMTFMENNSLKSDKINILKMDLGKWSNRLWLHLSSWKDLIGFIKLIVKTQTNMSKVIFERLLKEVKSSQEALYYLGEDNFDDFYLNQNAMKELRIEVQHYIEELKAIVRAKKAAKRAGLNVKNDSDKEKRLNSIIILMENAVRWLTELPHRIKSINGKVAEKNNIRREIILQEGFSMLSQ